MWNVVWISPVRTTRFFYANEAGDLRDWGPDNNRLGCGSGDAGPEAEAMNPHP
jgi:hypothetical protein